MSLFVGWVRSDDPKYEFTDIFIEGNTVEGPLYKGDGGARVNADLSVGFGVFKQRSTTIHSHPFGKWNDFSNEPRGWGTGGDIQWSMEKGVDLYLVPPNGNQMGVFSPKDYNQYKSNKGKDPAYNTEGVKDAIDPAYMDQQYNDKN